MSAVGSYLHAHTDTAQTAWSRNSLRIYTFLQWTSIAVSKSCWAATSRRLWSHWATLIMLWSVGSYFGCPTVRKSNCSPYSVHTVWGDWQLELSHLNCEWFFPRILQWFSTALSGGWKRDRLKQKGQNWCNRGLHGSKSLDPTVHFL